MAKIRPFAGIRPTAAMAATIAALPYDVYNRAEAKAVVAANPDSFLAIDRAETQFADDVDTYDPRVYDRASSMLREWMADGRLIREARACYYIYELTMDGRTQTGIVGCASIDDYLNSVIKKHENTRVEKEQDRIRHVDTCGAQTGPIFLAYRSNAAINAIVTRTKEKTPLYDFESDDQIRHRVFVIDDDSDIEAVERAFDAVGGIYIADGHHRAASAVKVGLKRREEHPGYTGSEEFNYFLAVLFADEELMIMDYNRVVHDLNGMDAQELLERVKERFDVELLLDGTLDTAGAAEDAVRPKVKGDFSMFLADRWYRCTMRDIPDDPVAGLDVSVLQDRLLSPVLGIGDPKTDARIDFVGGIRGMKELERRCHMDCAAAFAMYPTSIGELFSVADAGLLMPPKSTWFEPKLRSGLFIHEI